KFALSNESLRVPGVIYYSCTAHEQLSYRLAVKHASSKRVSARAGTKSDATDFPPGIRERQADISDIRHPQGSDARVSPRGARRGPVRIKKPLVRLRIEIPGGAVGVDGVQRTEPKHLNNGEGQNGKFHGANYAGGAP